MLQLQLYSVKWAYRIFYLTSEFGDCEVNQIMAAALFKPVHLFSCPFVIHIHIQTVIICLCALMSHKLWCQFRQ